MTMAFRRLAASAALAAALTATAAVPQPAAAAVDALDLVQPISDYKVYVSSHTQALLTDVTAFVAAIKAGDVEAAKAMYAPTRMSYEAIEPIAELFADLDASMDARADDFEQGEKDPAFTGFHRIEYSLWEKGTTDDLGEIADKLLADVTELSARIEALAFPPEVVVGGAAALMEEVAATKISGEEDRYSHTDLWDFRANFDGAYKIFDLVRPLIAEDDADFVARVEGNFATVDEILERYRDGEGYQLYDQLSDADRTAMSVKINTLAEDLSTLRGKLGLN